MNDRSRPCTVSRVYPSLHMLSAFHTRRTQPGLNRTSSCPRPFPLSLSLPSSLRLLAPRTTCILCMSSPSAAPPLVPNPINLALASDARPGLLKSCRKPGAKSCWSRDMPPQLPAHTSGPRQRPPDQSRLVQSKTRRPFLSTGNSNHYPIGPATAETPAQLHSIRLASLFSTILHSLDTIYLIPSNMLLEFRH